jgi:hypothetical protein
VSYCAMSGQINTRRDDPRTNPGQTRDRRNVARQEGPCRNAPSIGAVSVVPLPFFHIFNLFVAMGEVKVTSSRRK